MAEDRYLDGDGGFPLGMNGAIDADTLPPGMLSRIYNAVTRGSVVQARPGFDQLMQAPIGDRFQGGTLFRPTGSQAQLVFAVSGKVYISQAPFKEYFQLPNLQFDEFADSIYFESARWATDYNEDGSIRIFRPINVLLIQDGLSRPAYYDGSTAVHTSRVPLGTVMKWSGDRLWVARGSQLFASDYANPFGYREGKYIGSTGAFTFPSDVTALVEVSSVGSPFMLVFTADAGFTILTNQRNRDLWDSTPDFIYKAFPTVGCVGHRAWTHHNGKLWWFSSQGLVNVDTASQANDQSEFPFIDTPMSHSKKYLSDDLSGVTLGSMENYLLVSVPYADNYNRHTWVLDSSIMGSTEEMSQGKGWQGVWTGLRPVEWIIGTIDSDTRAFVLSKDRDGYNRVWEAFKAERRDNGCPFWWGFETRGYGLKNRQRSLFRYADFALSEIQGEKFFIKASYAGTMRGRYKQILNRSINATRGSIRSDLEIRRDSEVFAYKTQSRFDRSEDAKAIVRDPLSSCSVESDRLEVEDHSFQLCVSCLGPGAIRYIRVFGQAQEEGRSGKCTPDDQNVRAVRFDGGAVSGDNIEDVHAALSVSVPLFAAAASSVGSYRGVTAVGTAEQTSGISQGAANHLAECVAEMRMAKKLQDTAPGFLGGGAVCP